MRSKRERMERERNTLKKTIRESILRQSTISSRTRKINESSMQIEITSVKEQNY
jgi:hypothetical protein